jgi:hypothetical protein
MSDVPLSLPREEEGPGSPSDAAEFEYMLATGDIEAAYDVTRQVLAQLGWTQDEIRNFAWDLETPLPTAPGSVDAVDFNPNHDERGLFSSGGVMISIDRIKPTQPKKETTQAGVDKYVADFKSGKKVKPIVAIHDRESGDYLVLDGHHRLAAAKQSGLGSMAVRSAASVKTSKEAHQYVRGDIPDKEKRRITKMIGDATFDFNPNHLPPGPGGGEFSSGEGGGGGPELLTGTGQGDLKHYKPSANFEEHRRLVDRMQADVKGNSTYRWQLRKLAEETTNANLMSGQSTIQISHERETIKTAIVASYQKEANAQAAKGNITKAQGLWRSGEREQGPPVDVRPSWFPGERPTTTTPRAPATPPVTTPRAPAIPPATTAGRTRAPVVESEAVRLGKGVADRFAKETGYPRDLIQVKSGQAPDTIWGSGAGLFGRSFDPFQNFEGRVEIYPDVIASHQRSIDGTLAHEIMHQKYAHYAKDIGTADIIAHMNELESTDGHTPYSSWHWARATVDRTKKMLAVNETLAEMAAMKAKGQHDAFARIPQTWRTLFDAVDAHWTKVVKEGTIYRGLSYLRPRPRAGTTT